MSVFKQFAGGKKKNRNFVNAHNAMRWKLLKLEQCQQQSHLFCNLLRISPNSQDCQAPIDQSQCEIILYGVSNCWQLQLFLSSPVIVS